MPVINGKVVRSRYTSLKLGEISSVDRPAQPGAIASIMKRDMTMPKDSPLIAVAVAKYVSEEDGAHTFSQVLQANEFDEKIWPMTSALSQAIRSIMGDRDLSSAEKEGKVTQSVAEFLSSVRTISPAVAADAEKRLAELISKKDDTMPKTIEELTAKVAELTGQLTAANALAQTEKARADTAEAALATEKTAHEATQKSLTEATDEVITVGGTELRKSVAGVANFTVAKALADERDMAKIEKRVETEFSHVAGSTTEKALVLKAADRMDEPTRKAFDAILTSAEKMAAGAFKQFGHGQGEPSEDVAKAQSDWTAKVAEIAKRDSIPEFEAMSKARTEFPAEFAAYQEALAA